MKVKKKSNYSVPIQNILKLLTKEFRLLLMYFDAHFVGNKCQTYHAARRFYKGNNLPSRLLRILHKTIE
jgi:hypothetical protein